MHRVIKPPMQVDSILQFSGVNGTESPHQPGSAGRDNHSPYTAKFFPPSLEGFIACGGGWAGVVWPSPVGTCSRASIWSGFVALQSDASAHTNACGCSGAVPRGCLGPLLHPKAWELLWNASETSLTKLFSFSVSMSKSHPLRYNEMFLCLFRVQW